MEVEERKEGSADDGGSARTQPAVACSQLSHWSSPRVRMVRLPRASARPNPSARTQRCAPPSHPCFSILLPSQSLRASPPSRSTTCTTSSPRQRNRLGCETPPSAPHARVRTRACPCAPAAFCIPACTSPTILGFPAARFDFAAAAFSTVSLRPRRCRSPSLAVAPPLCPSAFDFAVVRMGFMIIRCAAYACFLHLFHPRQAAASMIQCGCGCQRLQHQILFFSLLVYSMRLAVAQRLLPVRLPLV